MTQTGWGLVFRAAWEAYDPGWEMSDAHGVLGLPGPSLTQVSAVTSVWGKD